MKETFVRFPPAIPEFDRGSQENQEEFEASLGHMPVYLREGERQAKRL